MLGDGVDVVIRPPDAALAQMGDFVREMHTSSGLLTELADGVTMEEAQRLVLDYVREWVPEPRKAPLGGNTVATDRGFLARDMAELEAHLHYRIIDVSSIKELSRRWFPRAYFAAPDEDRRAPCARRHPRVDRRAALLPRRRVRDPPGRATDELRALAAEHVVDHRHRCRGADGRGSGPEAVRSTPGEQVR